MSFKLHYNEYFVVYSSSRDDGYVLRKGIGGVPSCIEFIKEIDF